jgi:hypothetical protein
VYVPEGIVGASWSFIVPSCGGGRGGEETIGKFRAHRRLLSDLEGNNNL